MGLGWNNHYLRKYWYLGDGMGGYEYLEQCASILLRQPNRDDALKVRYFFDITRAKLPTIHFNLPGESTGINQSIGYGSRW